MPIGSTFNQMLYAAKFWDSSILLSGRVNSESKIIYDRDPRTMVEKVAPWLTVDCDAYPAVVDGRLIWILDGYTTTADYPMSQHVDLSETTSDSLTPEDAVAAQKADDINYIRNSVKATVDAYDGTVTLYEWDTGRRTGTAAEGVDEVPSRTSVAAQGRDLRRPAGAPALPRGHVQGAARDAGPLPRHRHPTTFYGGSENWKVPEDPTGQSTDAKQPPYYLTVKLPKDVAEAVDQPDEPEFSLTSVYEPNAPAEPGQLHGGQRRRAE